MKSLRTTKSYGHLLKLFEIYHLRCRGSNLTNHQLGQTSTLPKYTENNSKPSGVNAGGYWSSPLSVLWGQWWVKNKMRLSHKLSIDVTSFCVDMAPDTSRLKFFLTVQDQNGSRTAGRELKCE